MYKFQQCKMWGPVLQPQQPHPALQACGNVAGKLPNGKGPGVAGQQLAECEPAVFPDGQLYPGLYEKQCDQQDQ